MVPLPLVLTAFAGGAGVSSTIRLKLAFLFIFWTGGLQPCSFSSSLLAIFLWPHSHTQAVFFWFLRSFSV